MFQHVNKSTGAKGHVSVTSKQNGTKGNSLADNRPQAVAQRQLIEAVHNSQQQRITDNRPVQATPGLIQKQTNNTGLPTGLKTGIEQLSGFSMDDVKVHYNSAKPAQLQAHAYAQGTDIYVAPGQQRHLPHEAWHVVQQKQGRVRPTLQMKGRVAVNDDKGLEQEADVMGAKAATANFQGLPTLKYSNGSSEQLQPVVQAKWIVAKNDYLVWDNLIDGVRWFWNLKTNKLHYIIETNEGEKFEATAGVENANTRQYWVEQHGSDPLQGEDNTVTSVPTLTATASAAAAAAAQPSQNQLKKIETDLISTVKQKSEALQKQGNIVLVRFFNNESDMNSKAYQKKPDGTGGEGNGVSNAKKHMHDGETENSAFVSFTEDIKAFMESLRPVERSEIVNNIVKGGKVMFYGKGKEYRNISRPPAKYVGIFSFPKNEDIVTWEQVKDPTTENSSLSASLAGGNMSAPGTGTQTGTTSFFSPLTKFSKPTVGSSMKKNASLSASLTHRNMSAPETGTKKLTSPDLKQHYIAEKEVVVYSPGKLKDPDVVLTNPFYEYYLSSISMSQP